MVTTEDLLGLYDQMVTARRIDLLEQDYTGRGEAFFHVSGAGHEASAALARHLTTDDWLHCHYRDKALMLARGVDPQAFFLALFNKDRSHSRGRQMNAHMSAPELRLMSLVGPVGNSALQAVGVAQAIKDQFSAPIVLCSLGDGMTQQGEVLEAVAHAVRNALPVLFLIQDNRFAISTKTGGKTFYSRPDGDAASFYGIPITRIDGRDPAFCWIAFGQAVAEMRTDRKPQIVVLQVERLHNHTNADDQRLYRSSDEIEQVRATGDPIANLITTLESRGVARAELAERERRIAEHLAVVAKQAQESAEPQPIEHAAAPLPPQVADPAHEYRGDRAAQPSDQPELTMLEAIRAVLHRRMQVDERVVLFGEDIEDPKGDVFGLTRGLTHAFPGRVENSPLAEATIVGVAVGQALAGRRPVAFLQFADFLPIAFNQIISEMGSMYWRSDGGWHAPVILMISCGGYRPGLGPFHASSLEALAAHVPGVDIVMPSAAGDAAGLLNAAFESGRPTLFFYPKNCLNDRVRATSNDVDRQMVPLGVARCVRRGPGSGHALTFVAWGNTVTLCEHAADVLAEHGVATEVIDLRSLAPWDSHAVLRSVAETRRLIVAHEDNHTCGFGAEVLATVAERSTVPVAMRRVTRADTFVPCNFENQLAVLPSFKRILATAVELLGGSVSWRAPAAAADGITVVEAIGSSPSDETVSVVRWLVGVGDRVRSGQLIAELEADKAAFDFNAPVDGLVTRLELTEGESTQVGAPLLRIDTTDGDGSRRTRAKAVTKEDPGTPIIGGLNPVLPTTTAPTPDGAPPATAAGQDATVAVAAQPAAADCRPTVVIADVVGAPGSRIVTNAEISRLCPEWDPDDIFRRVGITSRPWLAADETPLSIAVRACTTVLARNNLTLADLGLVVCATETPSSNTPSMSALIQHALQIDPDDPVMVPAFDLNAACSGFVYALQVAYDFLSNDPHKPVLLVTTEALSPRIDFTDPGTAPIFADAATAALIVAEPSGRRASAPRGERRARVVVNRPVLGAQGESGEWLRVPADPAVPIFMDGPKVYLAAIRGMMAMLQQACTQADCAVADLDLVVPHQANQRIINAIRQRAGLDTEQVYSNIAHYGNTSSSTIPLCLEELYFAGGTDSVVALSNGRRSARVGLTAFGGGFTFAAAVLDVYPLVQE